MSLTEITAMARARLPLGLDGASEMQDLVNTDGNTEANTLRVDGELIGRANEHRYHGSRDCETDLRITTSTYARNWTGSFRYDRFVTKRLFVNANTILANDRLRDLDLRVAVGSGLGVQVIDTPRTRITTDAGLGWVNEAYGAANDVRYTAVQESAKLEIFFSGTRFVFFHRHDGYFSVTGDSNQISQDRVTACACLSPEDSSRRSSSTWTTIRHRCQAVDRLTGHLR